MQPSLTLQYFWHAFRHLHEEIPVWSQTIGPGKVYVILFAIIFCETGLVVLPFLPGDSLLFAIGAICALDTAGLELHVVIPLLIIAAVLGDAVNYHIGERVGERAFTMNSRFIKKKHLEKTQAFYEKYGGKTIVFARFVPIVRTFAPFVAGIGRMQYGRFVQWNILGAIAWVGICVVAGFTLGRMEFIQKNFERVIVVIILISVAPMAIEIWRERSKVKTAVAKLESLRVDDDDDADDDRTELETPAAKARPTKSVKRKAKDEAAG